MEQLHPKPKIIITHRSKDKGIQVNSSTIKVTQMVDTSTDSNKLVSG